MLFIYFILFFYFLMKMMQEGATPKIHKLLYCENKENIHGRTGDK